MVRRQRKMGMKSKDVPKDCKRAAKDFAVENRSFASVNQGRGIAVATADLLSLKLLGKVICNDVYRLTRSHEVTHGTPALSCPCQCIMQCVHGGPGRVFRLPQRTTQTCQIPTDLQSHRNSIHGPLAWNSGTHAADVQCQVLSRSGGVAHIWMPSAENMGPVIGVDIVLFPMS